MRIGTPLMRAVVVASAVGCLATAAAAFRAPAPLTQVLGTADAVLIAEIVSIKEAAVELRVVEHVLGASPKDGVRWPLVPGKRLVTEPRWAPYAPGQVMLIFLRIDRSEGGGRSWQFVTTGTDSEWLVDGETVYFTDRFVTGLEPHAVELEGRRFHASSLPRATTLDALRSYGSCFRWNRGEGDVAAAKPAIVCDDGTLLAYRRRSALHEHLVRESVELAANR